MSMGSERVQHHGMCVSTRGILPVHTARDQRLAEPGPETEFHRELRAGVLRGAAVPAQTQRRAGNSQSVARQGEEAASWRAQGGQRGAQPAGTRGGKRAVGARPLLR